MADLAGLDAWSQMAAAAHFGIETGTGRDALGITEVLWDDDIASVMADRPIANRLERHVDRFGVGRVGTDVINARVDKNSPETGNDQRRHKHEGSAWQMPMQIEKFSLGHRVLPFKFFQNQNLTPATRLVA